MLTVAYCRVSTEEQAAEGFSVRGQAEKLKTYAELHDLGEVMVITDPGLSGKNLERPGLQRLLAMVEDGHVAHVLTWRLDRLSRNLQDLILLADRFGQHGVALHSFSERIDLSSATGRMFYNILGSFAQFYREQLAENVRMGMAQGARQGRWMNRPPTGYDLVDGHLVPNDDAPLVRRIFTLRGEGASQGDIAAATGVNYSTARGILHKRVYLGEVVLNGEWFPGTHEPLITPEEFAAAHRGRTPGRRKGKDLMSGRVRCGLCNRLISLDVAGSGLRSYRCRHRGSGCALPRRRSDNLVQAALLGLRLIARDTALQAAIRQELDRSARPAPAGRRPAPLPATALDDLLEQRRKLLRLHYDDMLSAEQFGEEQARLTALIDTTRAELEQQHADTEQHDDITERFDQLAELLGTLDLDRIWDEATEIEQRTLLDELVQEVSVHDDHLEVVVHGAPRLNVLLSEVGLAAEPERISGVGGATRTPSYARQTRVCHGPSHCS